MSKLQSLNYLYHEKVTYFALKKEGKVETKYKNIESKLPQF